MKIVYPAKLLADRIKQNRNRLSEPYYSIEQVFMPYDYGWPGDKEGRALLAFACHRKMGSEPIACLDQMLVALPDRVNQYGYFGLPFEGIFDEQQLSGHSWYLRGLCTCVDFFGRTDLIPLIKATVEHLYLPLIGKIGSYPLGPREKGQVSGGTSSVSTEVWRLSTDVGCAFMSIDGLSHAYEITRDRRTLALLDEMIETFSSIDLLAIRAQTHCSLSAARGMLRMYHLLGRKKDLNNAIRIAELYRDHGMTLTFQNKNWWGRDDSWTEPCAIVDSMILFDQLHELTREDQYRRLAVRIAWNGLATAQRPNGGAGCETLVLAQKDCLSVHLYEAPFCCSMRLAEGLLYLKENIKRFEATIFSPKRDERGRLMQGDLLMVPYQKHLIRYSDERFFCQWDDESYMTLPIALYMSEDVVNMMQIPLTTGKLTKE